MEQFEEINNKINSLKKDIEEKLSSFYQENKQHLDNEGNVNKNFLDKIGGIEVYHKWINLNELDKYLNQYLEE